MRIYSVLLSVLVVLLNSCIGNDQPIDIPEEEKACSINSIETLTNKVGYVTNKWDPEKFWTIHYIPDNCAGPLRLFRICSGFPDSLKIERQVVIFSGEVKGELKEGSDISFFYITDIHKCKFDCLNDNIFQPIVLNCPSDFNAEAHYMINNQAEYDEFKMESNCSTNQKIDFSKFSLVYANIIYGGCCAPPTYRYNDSTKVVTIDVMEIIGCKRLNESKIYFLVTKESRETIFSLSINRISS